MYKQNKLKTVMTRQANRSRKAGCIEGVIIRRFDPDQDSIEALTLLLHCAFSRLGEMGLNCSCVDQNNELTRQRVEAGECFVAVVANRVIATMTVYERDQGSACAYYRTNRVTTIRQYGVDPAWQGRGIGQALLDYAEHWAARHGYIELELDTPHAATHLMKFYRGRGFRMVRVMRFSGKFYESAISARHLSSLVL